MANVSGPIVQSIRGMVEGQHVNGLSDRELLCRFVAEQDETAFRNLMRRHGPVVLDVCRSMLVNPADAEDAFQATFLVLARKAKCIREATSLGSWLHGVAYRIALKARAEFTRRKKHESLAPTRELVESVDDLTWRDVKAVVHRELDSLPESLRAILVLCYLEGKTQNEVAHQLNLPKGTLKGKLERGRALLRERLIRRGFGPAAVLVTWEWSTAELSALPTTLIDSTLRAATRFATDRTMSDLVSTRAVTLTEAVVRAMFITRLKIATALLLVLGVFGAYCSAFMSATPPPEQKETNRRSVQETAGPNQNPPPVQASAGTAEKPVSPDDDRAVAEWVIGKGGRVQTTAGNFGTGDSLGSDLFHITAISLASTDKIKDDDLARFKNLKKLNNLFLAQTPVGDAGLKHLAGIKSLESLYLPGTQVGDVGLEHLKELTGLVNLYLDGTKVTNTGLQHLTRMTGLRILYLRQTQVTDSGLKHLEAMTNLCWVDVWGTKVTEAGVRDFQAALPRCSIKNVDPKKDRPPPAAEPLATVGGAIEKLDLPVGKWKIEFSNGVTEVCQVGNGGESTVEEPLRTANGMAAIKAGSIVITFNDDRVERWTPIGKRYVVEHWYPASQVPVAIPVLGIAETTP